MPAAYSAAGCEGNRVAETRATWAGAQPSSRGQAREVKLRPRVRQETSLSPLRNHRAFAVVAKNVVPPIVANGHATGHVRSGFARNVLEPPDQEVPLHVPAVGRPRRNRYLRRCARRRGIVKPSIA